MGPAVGSGSVQAFAIHDLPRFVRLLAAGGSRVRACQAVGVALYRALELPAVELALAHDDRAGIVFTTGAAADLEPPPHELASPSGAVLLRVAFHDDDQRLWLEPILKVTLELLDLGSEVAVGDGDLSELPPDPAGPEPRTLDETMSEIYAQARSIAAGDIGVLIRGGSGSGKEVLAHFIHRASPRAGELFMALNCAALPRDLLEAELFGVERGVATGVEERSGLLERAHRGTLFLDEIGDMAPDTQAKILRVMQEGEVSRVGGSRARPADARILAATNRDLESLLDLGGFRGDLYHRLAGWEVVLPDLGDRRADIPNLAAFFLDREMRRLGLETGGLSRATLRSLVACPWPGNVRQLERQMMRTALFLSAGEVLDAGSLESVATAPREAPGATLEDHLETVERRVIARALRGVGGDIERAAKELAVGRSTLYRRIKQLGIETGE